MLRTIIAPVVHKAGMEAAAEGWLREATRSAVRPANVPCSVTSATSSGRLPSKSRGVQHQLSHRTWQDSGSPLARQRFCDLSTPDLATLTSPIAFSSRPGPWSPTSATCCKKPASPRGNSCPQPLALRTERINLTPATSPNAAGVRICPAIPIWPVGQFGSNSPGHGPRPSLPA